MNPDAPAELVFSGNDVDPATGSAFFFNSGALAHGETSAVDLFHTDAREASGSAGSGSFSAGDRHWLIKAEPVDLFAPGAWEEGNLLETEFGPVGTPLPVPGYVDVNEGDPWSRAGSPRSPARLVSESEEAQDSGRGLALLPGRLPPAQTQGTFAADSYVGKQSPQRYDRAPAASSAHAVDDAVLMEFQSYLLSKA